MTVCSTAVLHPSHNSGTQLSAPYKLIGACAKGEALVVLLVRNLALASRNAACAKAFQTLPAYPLIFLQVTDSKWCSEPNRQIRHQKYDDPGLYNY